MDRREIIAQTLRNMGLIYRDISAVAQIVEGRMAARGFRPPGDAAFAWEVSTAYNAPEGWLYRFFARAFLKDSQPGKVVGYCIHLEEDQKDRVERLGVAFPFVNVSLLTGEGDIRSARRLDLYNCLWGAGWFPEEIEVKDNIVRGRIAMGSIAVSAVTYFVDLLSLDNEDAVNRLVVEPLTQMHNCQEDWVYKNRLPVITLRP